MATDAVQCSNCGGPCEKQLRCGVCKRVCYCSVKCQKEDWQFHKRTCSKPVEKGADAAKRFEGLAEAKHAQETIDAELADKDPVLAAQVKQMMSGMLGSQQEKEAAKEEPAPKATCKSCMEACEKPLRCGVCKLATYCSAKCQKEDWRFHKRICKKAEESESLAPQGKAAEGAGKPSSQTAVDRPSREEPVQEGNSGSASATKTSDKVVVNDEDVGTWYTHRNWKPKEEKKEFAPERVSAKVDSKAPDTASAWNAAGTWEEKNMLPWWQEKLQSRVKALTAESTVGRISVEKFGEVSGEAQIVHIRGTPRFLFDLRFDIHFACQFPTSSKVYRGTIQVEEFSHELVAASTVVPMKVTAESQSDKRAVEASFLPLVRKEFEATVMEYQQCVAVREGGAFPGQLPPAA